MSADPTPADLVVSRNPLERKMHRSEPQTLTGEPVNDGRPVLPPPSTLRGENAALRSELETQAKQLAAALRMVDALIQSMDALYDAIPMPRVDWGKAARGEGE